MKQIYFGRCAPGSADDAASEFGPRAASEGLTPDRVAAAVAFTNYARAADGSAPERLALLNDPYLGRVVVHCDADGDAHFAHVLLDVPETLDADRVILTWGSPSWQRSDPGGGSELPELPYLPVAERITPELLREFLAAPRNRDLLEFILAALLAGPFGGRVIVAAPARSVALCVYGVTRALPQLLLDELTFSTFEPDPLASPAMIVGCQPIDELPKEAFGPETLAINTFTGRQSELRGEVPFASFAVEALATGKTAALDEFRATWQRLGVRDAGHLDMIYRLARGTGTLTIDEARQALHNSAMAAWISARTDVVRQFLEWALEDSEFATESFGRAVRLQRPEALPKLAQAVRDESFAALREGDSRRASNGLEIILPMVAPGQAPAIWDDVLKQFPDPSALDWPVRWFLLPRLVQHLKSNQSVDPALRPWLRVPPDKLADLLATKPPKSHQLYAALLCVEAVPEPGPDLARTLAANPGLAIAVMKELARRDDGLAAARAVFAAVLGAAPDHPWVPELVRQGVTLPPGLLDAALNVALNADRVAIEPLVRDQGVALLELLPGQPSLNTIAERFLANPPADLLTSRSLLTFVKNLRTLEGLTDAVMQRLDAVVVLDDFLHQPTLAADVLQRVNDALVRQPPLFPPAVALLVRQKVGHELSARSASLEVQADLETVLEKLGRSLSASPVDLFRELVRQLQDHKAFWRQTELLHAFLAVAMGAPQSMSLAQQVDGLEGDAFGLALQASKRGGQKVLQVLNDKTATWPKAAQLQWGFLMKAVQPRGLSGWARDVGLFLAGVGVTVIVLLVLRWAGIVR